MTDGAHFPFFTPVKVYKIIHSLMAVRQSAGLATVRSLVWISPKATV